MNTALSKPRRIVAAAIALAFGALPLAPVCADVVSDWNATAQAVMAATPGSQPGIYFPLVHIAIYDAVNAIDGGYSVFAVRPTSNPRGASREAAAAAAAHRVLANEFPGQAALIESAYAASLSAIGDGAAKTAGVTIGEEVATAWLASRAGDGRTPNGPAYVFNNAPGNYQPTPPANGNPIVPWLARVRPFALERPSQFRAYGPPDLTSADYAQDLALTRQLGASNSTVRTAQQTEIAMFHTESPLTFWAHNIRDLAAARRLSVTDNARLFAMVFVGFGDGTIACWDSKYYFNFWRPVTAIQRADTDDNPATTADPAWLPLAVTPPHPEYPAAHGCVSTAVAGLIADFFRTERVNIRLTSSVANTVPHDFQDTDRMVNEVLWARVYGGMHFLTSVRHGAIIGQKVANWTSSHYFQPVRRPRHP